jgi:hypothetical protein
MSIATAERAVLPARTHAQAAEFFRRPFAPGAIGFRAMMKVPLNGDPLGGAQVAAYIAAQSILQRLNAVVPGRWRQEFKSIDPPPGSKRLYMLCRADHQTADHRGRPRHRGRLRGRGRDGWRLARRAQGPLLGRAQVRRGGSRDRRLPLHGARASGLPIGQNDRQVQLIRRTGKPDVLALSPGTEQWLRHGYQQRIRTEAVRRDLGENLSHGEPDRGMGQGEAAEQPAGQTPDQAFWEGELSSQELEPAERGTEAADATPVEGEAKGNGVVVVDFRGLGPAAA